MRKVIILLWLLVFGMDGFCMQIRKLQEGAVPVGYCFDSYIFITEKGQLLATHDFLKFTVLMSIEPWAHYKWDVQKLMLILTEEDEESYGLKHFYKFLQENQQISVVKLSEKDAPRVNEKLTVKMKNPMEGVIDSIVQYDGEGVVTNVIDVGCLEYAGHYFFEQTKKKWVILAGEDLNVIDKKSRKIQAFKLSNKDGVRPIPYWGFAYFDIVNGAFLIDTGRKDQPYWDFGVETAFASFPNQLSFFDATVKTRYEINLYEVEPELSMMTFESLSGCLRTMGLRGVESIQKISTNRLLIKCVVWDGDCPNFLYLVYNVEDLLGRKR